MWAAALDRMMARLARTAEIDIERLRAMSGSAQQHGSVYLNSFAAEAWRRLDPSQALAPQLKNTLSRAESPVWMDASTSVQCREIDEALGGAGAVRALTGSPACERFTGPQIRKFFQQQPVDYAATTRIHLVSSFLASLLAGVDAPIEPGDGSGMNLMDLANNRWSPKRSTPPARTATRLPPHPLVVVASSAGSRRTGRSATRCRRPRCCRGPVTTLEPDRHRHHSRRVARGLARHERHGVSRCTTDRRRGRRTCFDRRPATS
jgi:hypothetical protein